MAQTAGARRTQWGRSRQTPGGYTICTATYGNGASTGKEPIPAEACGTTRGRFMGRSASFAVAIGMAPRAFAVPPTAGGANQVIAARTSGFVSPSFQSDKIAEG